jgi:hypothetical protein
MEDSEEGLVDGFMASISSALVIATEFEVSLNEIVKAFLIIACLYFPEEEVRAIAKKLEIEDIHFGVRTAVPLPYTKNQ